MKRYNLKKGDVAYTTGVFIEWTGIEWKIAKENAPLGTPFESDSFYDGEMIEEIETNPYIEKEER